MTNQIAVIIPAAGRATRFGRDKLTEPLGGTPILARSVRPFLDRPDVASIIIATCQPDMLAKTLVRPDGALDPRIGFADGGPTRAHSVRNALAAVPDDIEWLAVHDAARPLVTADLIDRALAAARQHGAAVPAMPVQLTIKQAAGVLPAPVERTIPRQQLWAVQTPQVMRRRDLERAFDKCPQPWESITDDVQFLELIGLPVWLLPGDERNIKITTPTDLQLAELLLTQRFD